MSTEAWHQKWINKTTGWYNQKPHELLVNHINDLTDGCDIQKSSILVPLCGNSVDLLWLKNLGLNVYGVEVVKNAIEKFFEDFSTLQYKVVNEGHITKYQVINNNDDIGSLTIYNCNYFDFTSPQTFDFMWDRASIFALNEADRIKYVSKNKSLLSKNGRILLTTAIFDASNVTGPPYLVEMQELQKQFGENFDISNLDEIDMSGLGVFKEKCITAVERLYLIKPKI